MMHGKKFIWHFRTRAMTNMVVRNRKNVRRAEVDGKLIGGLEGFRYTLLERYYRERL
jgi:hypothetical protein